MSVVRRLRRAVGETARALPLAREATAHVARRQYEQRVQRFLVEKSGLADPRPDGIVYETAVPRGPLAPGCDAVGLLPSEPDGTPALPIEALERAIPKRHRGQVNLTGGPLFARADILDVVATFRAKGYRCDYATTDGSGLTPARVAAIEHLADRGVVRHVSIGADRLANAPGTRDEAGIQALTAVARRAGASTRLVVNATVRADSVESLPEVADAAVAAGATAVGLTHLMFATPDEVDETLRLVGETDPSIIATNVTHDPGIAAARVRTQVAALRTRCRDKRLLFDHRPKVSDAILDDYYTPGARLDGRCLYPFLHARVTFSGKLLFCPFIRIVVGDLTQQTVEEAWNTPRYKALRKTLVEQQLFPVCRRCCKVELTGTRLAQPVRVFTSPLPAMAGNV
jgi:MoaA/NifB/PqqE/SkfB family radical SAM enzyme